MGESRQELLHWLNSLLQLNVTKVEQCGTGAALCQVYDSVFMDLPMSRVKFNVNSEYAYIQNFKILQNACARHGVEKTVPIEQLVKCRMQDNLEFLQWTKRFWDQNYPGHDYDAIARRKGTGAPAANTPAPRSSNTTASSSSRKPQAGTTTTAAAATAASNRIVPRFGGGSSGGGGNSGSGGGSGSSTGPVGVLKAENETLKEAIGGLEKERDFYFSKLRDIELLLQKEVDKNPEAEKDDNGLVRSVQAILYSTEEGFEIPAEGGDEEGELEGVGVGRDGDDVDGAFVVGENGGEEHETF